MLYKEVIVDGPVIKDTKNRIITDFRFADPHFNPSLYAKRFAACWNKLRDLTDEEITSDEYLIVPEKVIDTAIRTAQKHDELLREILLIAEDVRKCNYTMARSNALTIIQKYKKG